MFAPRRVYETVAIYALAKVAMNPTRSKAPVMASRHFMRMVTAFDLFNVNSRNRAGIIRPIQVINRFVEKSYML